MSFKELSRLMAKAASSTLQMSFDPNAINKDMVGKIDENGLTPFAINEYVDSFLHSNGVAPKKQLQFRIRWLPILHFMAKGDTQGNSPARLELFKTAVYRAINSSLGDSSPEFRRAWQEFSESPADKELHTNLMTTLKNIGIGVDLVVQLNQTWKILFGSTEMASTISTKKNPDPQIITRYEAIDKKGRTIHMLTPAKADAASTTLAEYRIEEQRRVYDNIIKSPVSIISVHPGFDVSSSFGQHMIDGLSSSNFKVNIQNLANPNLEALKDFNKSSMGGRRAVALRVQGLASEEQGRELIEFLHNHFLVDDMREHTMSRVIFLINARGSTPKSAAQTLLPHLKRLLGSSTDVPAVGMNLKELNGKQAGELLYGRGSWSESQKNYVERMVELIRQQVPMLPALLGELRSSIKNRKSWKDIEAAIKNYGEGLRKARPDEMNKPLTIVSSPTDDMEWQRRRQINFTKKGYAIEPAYKVKPYDEFKLRVLAPNDNPSGNNGGSKVSKGFKEFLGGG